MCPCCYLEAALPLRTVVCQRFMAASAAGAKTHFFTSCEHCASLGGGRLRPPQPPRLFFRPAKSASEPKKLIETHRVSIVFHMGGGGAGNRVSIVFHMGGAAPPPPTPPVFFKACKECFRGSETC